MVAGAILAIGAVAVGLFFFKDDIALFFQSLNPLGKTQEAVSQAGENIFEFGKETRANLDKQILQSNINAKENEIKKQAEQAGFKSLEEFEMATDTCALVVGGSRKVCDVGMIGVDDTKLTQRFGGKSNVGTDTTKIMGSTTVKPNILNTTTRGQTRLRR